MILVDTSIWVEHLHSGSERLNALLRDGLVLTHPFVVGEIACGVLRNREEILRLLAALPEARVAEHDEVMRLVESSRLHGRGIDWVDAHLLASALLSRAALWTSDRSLSRVASSLGIHP